MQRANRWVGVLGAVVLAAGCGQVELPSSEALAAGIDSLPAPRASAAAPKDSHNPPDQAQAARPPALQLPRAATPALPSSVATQRLPPAPVEAPRAPAATLDLSYVSADFVAAVAVRPRELLAAPLMAEFVPAEKLAAWASAFALDPRDVEHALILAGTPHAKTGPAVGMVLRGRRPFDRAKIIAALAPAHDEVLYGDKTYLRNHEFAGQSVFFADDHTLVVAQQVQLERMLRAGDQPSPLLDRLRQVDASAPLVALLTFDPIRELVQEELARSPALPAPFNQFDSLPEHLAAIELRLEPTRLPLATLALEGRDAEAAQRLDQLARSGVAIFRGWLMRGAGRPPVEAESFQVQREGRMVSVAVGTAAPGAHDLLSRLFAGAGPASRPIDRSAQRTLPVGSAVRTNK